MLSVDAPAYALLLGFYLGDGHISRHPHRPGTHAFTAIQDAKYPDSVREIRGAIEAVFTISAYTRLQPGAVEARTWTRHAICLFPQHGRGRKHTRAIVLRTWQRDLVQADPRPFLRGLFHSDGCRSLNTVHRDLPSGRRTYRYPRYLFANESDDILGLCECARPRGCRAPPEPAELRERGAAGFGGDARRVRRAEALTDQARRPAGRMGP